MARLSRRADTELATPPGDVAPRDVVRVRRKATMPRKVARKRRPVRLRG